MPGIHGHDLVHPHLVSPPEAAMSPRALGGGAPGSRPRGRRRECEALDRLVASTRSDQSQVLLLRGEAGTGKTALLDYLTRYAAGCRIARIAGAEPEMEMEFAGLHQLCAPFLDRLERLPGPQCDALRTAFSMRDGDAPSRFAVGLATVSLLSQAAEARPLICLVDDAQWLDRASAQALAFVARHLPGAPIAVVLAVRQPDGQQDLTGLPELPVTGLAESDARALLDSIVIGPLDERVRDRIIAETRGNPRALLEVQHGLTPAELAGGFGLPPSGLTLPRRAEESYRRRLAPLPPATRLLLLIAAAEPAGDPVLVWRAASYLGVEAGAAAPATTAGLVTFSGQVRLCDPQARTAIYQAAPPPQRQSVHRALAEATDPKLHPDQRAWHRAHASPHLDEDVAAELERSVGHARARGGLAAAAAFCERAAELTPEPGRRAHRALDAAQANYEAGSLDPALRLLAMAQAGPLDELGHARAELLRAQMAVNPDRGLLLLKAAEGFEPLDAGLAREAYRGAFDAALTAGRLEPRGGTRRVAEAVQAAPPAPGPSRAADLLLDGLALLVTKGHATGAPMLRQALRAARDEETPDEQAWRWLPFACRMAQVVWDDESWDQLSARLIELARRAGALAVLPAALAEGAAVRLAAGELTTAAAMTREAEAAVRITGNPAAQYGPALIAAWRGQQAEAAQLIAAATTETAARGEGLGLTAAAWATAVLGNGSGRYDEALAAAEQGSEDPDELGLATWALVELIEAAARTGSPDRAAGALRRLSEATSAAATNWALGIQARSAALLSDGEPAEQLYLEAIRRLGRTRIRTELARAHLVYGEWLRRQGRRGDAREQLRSAHEMLEAMGITGFAERARRELAATGESLRKRTIETTGELTAQEAQIARLASTGHSNPEISTQLFISPRTVEWHLRKVFNKLGISSRKALRAALSDLDRVPLSA
jgi:DNA-binding CsgD family transcriptional regulator